jgi:hypothetical protein
MDRAERDLVDRECPPVQGLGLGVSPLRPIKSGEVVDDRGRLGAIRAESLRHGREDLLVQDFGLGVLAERLADDGQLIQRVRHGPAVGSGGLGFHGGRLKRPLRLRESTLRVGRAALGNVPLPELGLRQRRACAEEEREESRHDARVTLGNRHHGLRPTP